MSKQTTDTDVAFISALAEIDMFDGPLPEPSPMADYTDEAATDEDLEQMARLVREGVEAGALGFSSSRTPIHKGMDGEFVPGTFADRRELWALGRAVVEGGGVMFQLTGNHVDMADEFGWMRELAAEKATARTGPSWPRST